MFGVGCWKLGYKVTAMEACLKESVKKLRPVITPSSRLQADRGGFGQVVISRLICDELVLL